MKEHIRSISITGWAFRSGTGHRQTVLTIDVKAKDGKKATVKTTGKMTIGQIITLIVEALYGKPKRNCAKIIADAHRDMADAELQRLLPHRKQDGIRYMAKGGHMRGGSSAIWEPCHIAGWRGAGGRRPVWRRSHGPAGHIFRKRGRMLEVWEKVA